MHKYLRFFVAGIALIFALAVLSGCDAGSNGSVATDLSSGSGYRIQLASSLESVKVGGSSTLTVVVFEPDGTPIRDGEEVSFASSEKGSFSDNTVKTSGGTAVVTYTAGDYPMKYDSVSATCHGATAVLQIVIVPENF
ncbi:MAG TPA: hypothetical protein PLM07_15475 [Candidatus Rifleibacterium sp.]|nr:hypothetical protein [Candidatus Rifleibacterium sp.]HPT47280.1 hypothetical protein [Candidatus Rifleibacterium sp.]